MSGLEFAAQSSAQLNLAAPSGDTNLSLAIHATCASFAEAVEFFIASNDIPAADDFSLARHLVVTEAKLKGALTQLRGNQLAARVMRQYTAKKRVAALSAGVGKERAASTWPPRATGWFCACWQRWKTGEAVGQTSFARTTVYPKASGRHSGRHSMNGSRRLSRCRRSRRQRLGVTIAWD